MWPRSFGGRLVGLFALLFAARAACVSQNRLPLLEVRLRGHLTSYSSPVGTPFKCVVLKSLLVDGRVFIPQGSVVSGSVRKAQAVGIGFRHERAALELQFNSYETPDGDRQSLSATLVSIDNAREQVTPRGQIKGVLAANNPSNLLNGFWARPSGNLAMRSLIGLTGAANQVWLKYSMGPYGAAGLFVVRCALVSFPEPEIHLVPGTDLSLRVNPPLNFPAEAHVAADRLPLHEVQTQKTAFESDGELAAWVRKRLKRISYSNGLPAPDLLNVVMLGSSEDVVSAFLASGWSSADVRSLGTFSRVYQAFSLKRNYASAPVSKLLYQGEAPDLVFEKSFDTVTQRHHVRFWRAGELNGKEVWLGAATHDTGVRFQVSSFTLTHKIDFKIDGERDKVATDLTFAGCSAPAEFLERVGPASGKEGRAVTDGRLVVLDTQSCEPDVPTDDPPGPPGNRLTRITRRVILEARNYLLRDNAYYLGYQLVKSSYIRFSPLLH